jgi:hypothetical protein
MKLTEPESNIESSPCQLIFNSETGRPTLKIAFQTSNFGLIGPPEAVELLTTYKFMKNEFTYRGSK